MDSIRAVFYPAGAKVGASVAQRALTTPQVGTGTVIMPAQLSLAVTLNTGMAGRHGRGRAYLPWNGVAVSTSGALPTSSAAGVAAAFKTLLTGLSATSLAGSGVAPVIATPSPLAGGATDLPPRPITSIGVGVVVDTQRRRRNKLADLKSTVLFP
jgi:hypothetical protein